jgi:GMP synthase-like glutamine amidotransferase
MISEPEFLILQHAECEPAGVHEQQLAVAGAAIRRVRLYAGALPPADYHDFAGLIVMGGPMGVYEDERYPWLAGELALIAAAAADGLPIWGVCLGAQLLAAALRAKVHPGDGPEIGVMEVQRAEVAAGDPVFGAAPDRFQVLQWHGDTYELPAGAVRLAGSARYPQQAFRVGKTYGLQFHLELSPDLLGEWAQLPAYADGLRQAHGEGALPGLLAAWKREAPQANALARELFGRWLSSVVGLEPSGDFPPSGDPDADY